VSLVPSLTEWLFDLGLEEEVVGITKFCVHPVHWQQTKPRVGGTKRVDVPRVLALAPDLVVASKEENVREQVEALARAVPVLLTDVQNFNDALAVNAEIGRVTGRHRQADGLNTVITNSFIGFPLAPAGRALYLIWRKPYMTIGADTYIHSMLHLAGFTNVAGCYTRYPEVTVAEMQAWQPDWVLLSSEPYPFREKHLQELHDLLPQARVRLVDGEMFSWYGSRMKEAAAYFSSLRNG
jgi:ABC-type Fe3+-hydroxamate transport system substrate-binding protein